MTETTPLVVPAASAGQRLDVFLAEQFPQFSRVQLRRALEAGDVEVDGTTPAKPSLRLRGGERIVLRALPDTRLGAGPTPEALPLEVLYEDEHLAAINKPPGMVVHPAKGNWQGTLTNALAHHFQALSQCGGPTRPGIVHRLDRDTSGLIVIAKTDRAHHGLARQFAERTVRKEYFAILAGELDRDRDRIAQPIGPHPQQREKMAIREGHAQSRTAETYYEVQRRYRGYCTVLARPTTGRTHQIRLHLAHAGAAVLCDRLYSGRARLTWADLTESGSQEILLDRQALHALRLQIRHPVDDRLLELSAPLPADLQQVLAALEQHRRRD